MHPSAAAGRGAFAVPDIMNPPGRKTPALGFVPHRGARGDSFA